MHVGELPRVSTGFFEEACTRVDAVKAAGQPVQNCVENSIAQGKPDLMARHPCGSPVPDGFAAGRLVRIFVGVVFKSEAISGRL